MKSMAARGPVCADTLAKADHERAELLPAIRRQPRLELLPARLRVARSPRPAKSRGDAVNMRVDRDATCLTEADLGIEVGDLGTDSRQREQLSHLTRHVAAVLVHQRPREL